MPGSGPPTKKPPAKKKAKKKDPLRKKLWRSRKKVLLGVIALIVIAAIAAFVITDEDPQPCPILGAVQEEIDADQGFHQQKPGVVPGGTSNTCWFQSPNGANALSVSVEVITYDHAGGAAAEFQNRIGGSPSTEQDSSWEVKTFPVGQTGKLQEMEYTHTQGNRLCIVAMKRPFNAETTPDDVEIIHEGAQHVATAACNSSDA